MGTMTGNHSTGLGITKAGLCLALIAGICGFWASLARAGVHDFEQSFEVEAGTILQVENHQGFVLVQAWDGARVLVTADYGRRGGVEVLESRSRLRVLAEAKRGRKDSDGPGRVEFAIRVPRGMEVRVEGHRTDVELENMGGRVEVDVLDGDVFVTGGREHVVLRSVQGSVEVHGAEGEIELHAPNEDIELRDCTGPIEAESVNGDIRMEGISSSSVDAITTQGDILYDGSLLADGDYYFSSHQGDVSVGLPADADLHVSVVTYSGHFEHDLDLVLERPKRGQRVEFELGAGRGRLRIESFSGDIHLFDPKRGRAKRG